jgi:ribose 1,5-bisphosphokinase PhnN
MQASHTCSPCSTTKAEDVRRRVTRSDLFGAENPEQFSIDTAEEENAHASLHWNAETTSVALMLKDNVFVNAPHDFIKAQKLMEV